MIHKIPCFCDNSFPAEAPETIDLDVRPLYLQEILDGAFMNFTCPSCGKIHKPEFPLTLLWPSKNLTLEVIPELERISFYRKKQEGRPKGDVVIGYPELAERLRVIRDNLEVLPVEALKYYLFMKAQEQNQSGEIALWYEGQEEGALVFHIQGLREDAVAAVRIPQALYENTLRDSKSLIKSELFTSLRVRNYYSIKNMMLPGELTR